MNSDHKIMAAILGISIIAAAFMIMNGLEKIRLDPQVNADLDTGRISYAIEKLARAQGEIKQEQESDDVLYLSEAADYLGISGDVLRQLIQEENADIPYVLINERLYLFHKEALKNWLSEGQKKYNLND
ncbi:MAG: hypothetical protein H0Z33_03570 [Bacillaceae bacterium]|nr:hypothetical protein [Bacillaceae bacterium]